MQKIDIVKGDNNLLVKYDNGEKLLLSQNLNYNIYNYHSRKAFMIRISDGETTNFFLSPDINLKQEVEILFDGYIKKKNTKDFNALAFPIIMCVAYITLSIVTVLI